MNLDYTTTHPILSIFDIMKRRTRFVYSLPVILTLAFSTACPSHQPVHANVPAAVPSAQNNQGGLEVLSDTRGVDFGPYLSHFLHDVRENWYRQIPEEAKAPTSKQGAVTLQFQIMKDGSLSALKCTLCTSDD